MSSAFPDASVSCILADDGLHFAVRAVLDDAVYLLDTTALVPDRALVVPPLGDGPSAAKAYESAGRVPTALVLLHRCAAENVVMSGFYAGVGKVRERHYRFDLSAPPTDPRPYLRDGDYVRAVVKADGLLVNRVYSEEFGFLSWYKPLQKGARLVAPTDPRTRETVALEKDDSAFCAFLRAANLGCEDLDAQAIRAVDWINENCGRARIPPIRQTWGQGS
ncbi:hypothetical protein [Falsiruegeria litorea]|uniref:hypothetical protein n=1 Tax=Falsiruegeria litorea TaxID=1280831 RepID=UPI0013FDA02C|nr:hypothetical protein [Falsiruegeria litorea]